MQEKFPVFILIASELLDLSGAPGAEQRVGGVLALSFPGETQPGLRSGPVPSAALPITDGDVDEVTIYFQTAAADATDEATADGVPTHTEMAAGAAVLPGGLPGSSGGSGWLHTAAALKLRDGQALPSKLWDSTAGPVPPRGSQPDTPVSTLLLGPPQPSPSAGMHRGHAEPAAGSSTPGIKGEAPGLETSPLPSADFHPLRKETAASLSPTTVTVAPEWAPPGSRQLPASSPWAQPSSTALTPTQSAGAMLIASLQQPASGEPAAMYSRTTQRTAIPFSPALSLKQGTTGSEGRNSTTAGHAAQLSMLQNVLQGSVLSSSLLTPVGAPGHNDLPQPLSQEPPGAAGSPQPVLLPWAPGCTKHHTSQESSRSSRSAALVLQRDAEHELLSKPETSGFPENPQASADSSSVSRSQMSILHFSQATTELKQATSALPAGTSALLDSAPRAVSTPGAVHAALQPPGASTVLQPMGVPTSGRGLHAPTPSTSTRSGSQISSISAHPQSQETFAMLHVSTVEDSKGKRSLPQQIGTAASPVLLPQASPSLSAPHEEHQAGPSASPAPQPGSGEAPTPKLHPLHALEHQSSTAAHPEPPVPAAAEIPAHLAQVLAQHFSSSHSASSKNLSAFGTDHLKMLPSYPYLSFLLRSTDGMMCLLPLPGSALPPGLPNTSVGALVSAQQILSTSNSSLLDPGDLHNLSLPGLILVKPVFILLPTDAPGPQAEHSLGCEGSHSSALLDVNKQGLDTVTTTPSHDIAVHAASFHPTSKHSRPEAAPSAASSHRVEKSIPSTESLRRLPPAAGPAPSTVPAPVPPPAGHGGRGPVALHTRAAPTSPASVHPDRADSNTTHLELTPIVPTAFAGMETPMLAPVHSPFSAELHMKTATPGKLLAAITSLRLYPKPAAGLPSSVPTHVPPLSAMKHYRSSPAPPELFSRHNTGQDAEPAAVSTHVRRMGAGGCLGSSTSLPAASHMRTGLPPTAAQGSGAVSAPAQPSASAEPGMERGPESARAALLPPLAGAHLSAAGRDPITTTLTKSHVPFLPASTARSEPGLALPAGAGMKGWAEVSAAAGRSKAVQEGAAAAASLQPLGIEHRMEHGAAVWASGLPVTDPAVGLPLSMEEEDAGPHAVTEDTAKGSVTAPVRSQRGGEPRHGGVRWQGDALSSLAVVSDELCGSGNYTVRMSLSPMADAGLGPQGSAPPPDSFVALLAVQSSRQPALRVRSCCVTPTSSPGGPRAVCCPLPRLPPECTHIQLLPSSESGAVGFTIQLSQMLNHSVAYLHCELNVCLQGEAGCQQDCSGSTEPHPPPADRSSHGSLHNLVSLGPVLRPGHGAEQTPVQGPNSAMMVPILLGSLTGFVVLGTAFTSLWLHHRQKAKSPSYPQFREIRGL